MAFLRWILVCLLFSIKGHCQDTIYFSNHTSQAVKISEIGTELVKYHRFDNLDGPVYFADKKEINYIKFFNGYIDSVKVSNSSKFIMKPKVYEKVQPIPGNQKISILENKLFYSGKYVGELRLMEIIESTPDQAKKQALIKLHGEMNGFKKKQYLFGFGSLGVGLACLTLGEIGALFLDDEDTPRALALCSGAGVVITGTILSKKNKKKRIEKRIEIANLYNN